ncbi:hypothetical protein [Hymenobacter sp. PAMC 26628]|uniref:hypothetical protein n=1 Tax=Hymenobacter sp. PAMC 26628 TaxID=1484118 RepID=UPI0007705D5F|nr:hypothetical protein [Hymenobacter sp. PAMC 26628]AMJ67301.1 hypothetical protein AXW84_19145 [Hymenobacter sp. PAMC 26628]
MSQKAAPLPAESAAFGRAALAGTALRPAEKLGQYTKYNFGPLLLQASATVVVGFIGPDYQRLRVKVLTVDKSGADPALYQITGKTEVAGLVRAFRGTLRLQQVREATPVKQLYASEEGPLPDMAVAGVAVGRYELTESPAQDHTGIFRGVAVMRWYLDHRHRLHYDDINKMSDSFCNNQFAGSWTSYATKKTQRCNWGDYRIPNAGDFDTGAGELSPAEKYLTNGWQDYAAGQNLSVNSAARRREERTWWK